VTRVTKVSIRSFLCIAAVMCGGALSFSPALAAANPSASASRLGDRPLRLGASGSDVRQLQEMLVKAGFKTTVDGKFGQGTKNAVERFQRAVRLEVSGVVGKKTVSALRNALSGAAAQTPVGGFDSVKGAGRHHHLGDRVPLRTGMHGHDIKILQDYLRRAGLRTSVDGAFGKGTQRLVRAFEREQGRNVNGIVDAGDIDALRFAVDGDAGLPPELPTMPAPLGPGERATVGADGLAIAPEAAPDVVKQIIAAGNAIAKMPYRYGGGHGKWRDSGYDCSGSVSYALHGAGLLDASMPSGGFMKWGERGAGKWVTLFANGGHIYMVVAGLRFDTSGRSKAGTRWQTAMRSPRGYTVVHPSGL
jgi:peptidoglycan hydrolase-like protein with peptidoglycan-binding domain